MRHFLTHKTKVNQRFYLAQRMIGSHPLLQIDCVGKQLPLALPFSHHGTTALPNRSKLVYYFLSKPSDLGNTPFKTGHNCCAFHGCVASSKRTDLVLKAIAVISKAPS